MGTGGQEAGRKASSQLQLSSRAAVRLRDYGEDRAAGAEITCGENVTGRAKLTAHLTVQHFFFLRREPSG